MQRQKLERATSDLFLLHKKGKVTPRLCSVHKGQGKCGQAWFVVHYVRKPGTKTWKRAKVTCYGNHKLQIRLAVPKHVKPIEPSGKKAK
jgi:hypothetical protein